MATARELGFRPDIEGLRGIAILLVLLFHAAVGVPGGFVGVDVFFVISGFLITGPADPRARTDRSDRLQGFYARRVRRLLPAGMVALAVTLVASFAMLNPLDRPSAAADGAAAALSIGNIRFALAGRRLLRVGPGSLAVPAFLVARGRGAVLPGVAGSVLIVAGGLGARPADGTGLVLGLVLVTSLIANVVVTEVAVNWAFYSLPTRAWQLALGGLFALGAHLLRIPAFLRESLGGSGSAGAHGSGVRHRRFGAVSGRWALVPTLAAAALIVAG